MSGGGGDGMATALEKIKQKSKKNNQKKSYLGNRPGSTSAAIAVVALVILLLRGLY